MDTTIEQEQRDAEWLEEVAEEEVPAEITEEELAKREEEKQKVAEAETEETTTVSKRKGYKLYVHGTGFKKTDEMTAKIVWEDKVSRSSACVYKNQGMLGVTIPDLGPDVP